MPPEKAVIRCYLQAQVVMLPALYRCSFYMEWSRGSGRKLFWKYPARSLEGEGRDINEPDGAFHSAHGHSHAVESDPWCSSPDRWGLGEVFSAQMWWQQKRLTATAFQLRAVNLDCKGRKLTIADSTFSICSIVIFCRFVKRRCPPSLFLFPIFLCIFTPEAVAFCAETICWHVVFSELYL